MNNNWVWPEHHDYPGFRAALPAYSAQIGPAPNDAPRSPAVANLIIPDWSNPTGWREWWVYAALIEPPHRRLGL